MKRMEAQVVAGLARTKLGEGYRVREKRYPHTADSWCVVIYHKFPGGYEHSLLHSPEDLQRIVDGKVKYATAKEAEAANA